MQIKVPEIGESVHEAFLAKWFKHNGEHVVRDDVLCELETDKITLEINAEGDGQLNVLVAEGTTVKVGTAIAEIVESTDVSPAAPAEESVAAGSPPHEETILASVSTPAARREMRAGGISPDSVTGTGKGGRITLEDLFTRIEESSRRPVDAVRSVEKPSAPHRVPQAATPSEAARVVQEQSVPAATSTARQPAEAAPLPSPAVVEKSVSPPAEQHHTGERRDERIPLSPIRRKIAERLLAARQQTAMLTTFNEADLSQIKRLRENFREHFQQKYGIRLGYMPFFVKACVAALKEFPVLNASIDGGDIVHHRYYDIGIAIGAEKGLVVPILRDADQLRMYQIDQQIVEFNEKIRTNRLAISDLEGGTFSITNGGVYGSMLSTPILNPPQSAILGMHAIQDRPVVRDGQIVIRPMMYLALTYDHRLIDGREAVQFLAKVREYLETPEELLLEG